MDPVLLRGAAASGELITARAPEGVVGHPVSHDLLVVLAGAVDGRDHEVTVREMTGAERRTSRRRRR